MSILEVSGLRKVYTTRFGGSRVEALHNVEFTVEQGEYVAIMGESGSGKTTLLNILAALDTPTAGTVRLDGRDLSAVKEADAAAFRRDQLGIADLLKKYPYEVSGGQKQRAAVARALITQPRLLLADEPTGALDSRATDELLTLFGDVNRRGQTILMVTHSVKAASRAGRVLFIKDGEVFHQVYRGDSSDAGFYQVISDTLTMLQAGGDAR